MGTKRLEPERLPLEHAVQELKTNYQHITSVNDWAKHMGYSRSYFSRRIKKIFGRSPKEILKEAKMKKINEEIIKNPAAIGYEIAVNCGLNDEKALHKFLSKYFDTTLTALRQELL